MGSVFRDLLYYTNNNKICWVMKTKQFIRAIHYTCIVINHQNPGHPAKQEARTPLGRWAGSPRLMVSPWPRNPVCQPVWGGTLPCPVRGTPLVISITMGNLAIADNKILLLNIACNNDNSWQHITSHSA